MPKNEVVITINMSGRKVDEEEKLFFDFENKTISIHSNSLEEIKEILDNLSDYFKEEDMIKHIEKYSDINCIEYIKNKEYLLIKKKHIENEYKLYKKFYELIKKDNVIIDTVNITSNFKDKKESVKYFSDKADYIDLSDFQVDEIKDILSSDNIKDKARYYTKYNYNDSSSKEEIYDVSSYLLNIKDYVLRFNLSPLEKCIFIHDLIREREYKQVTNYDINNSYNFSSYSRSLFKIYNDEKIVCAGFSKLFSSILEIVGINSEQIIYYPKDDNESGHMSSIVYIDDDKYNIHSPFEIDTTWGRVIEKNKYDYQQTLFSYNHFARCFNEAIKIKSTNDLVVEDSSNSIDILNRRLNRLNIMLKNGDCPERILKKELELLVNSIIEIGNKYVVNPYQSELNIISNMISDSIDINRDYLIDLCKTVNFKTFGIDLRFDDFQKALYKVKMVEHSIDKDKFPFNKELFIDALLSRKKITQEDKLLIALFGKESILNPNIEENLSLSAARMSLISTLHKISNDKVDSNPIMVKNSEKVLKK